jgi:hypothetical protein
MKTVHWTGLLAGAMALSLVSPVWAHHSHAMFDHTKNATVSGTVTSFDYRNPHVGLYIDVDNGSGQKVNYWVEMSNVQNMIRRGIGHGTFKPGDHVTVKLHPLKDGRPGGNYVSITAADGKVYD